MRKIKKKGQVAEVTATTKEVVQQREATLCNKIREASANLEETEVATKTQEGTENPMEQMGEPSKVLDLVVEDPWEDPTSIRIASRRLTDGEL